MSAIQLTLVVGGIIGIVGGILVFAALGRHDPVRTVWDLREERVAPDAS